MENQNQSDTLFELRLEDENRSQIQTIAKWAKIMAVCAFVSYAIAIVLAIFGRETASLSRFNDGSVTVNGFSRIGNVAGALVTAIIGCAINYFLYRFAADIEQSISTVDQFKLNSGLSNLKTYFKILGILLLIVAGFVGLIVLLGIASGGISR
jgi:hypothetical protein